MTSAWTHDAVAALAPDSSSARSGEGLSKPGQWSLLGRSPRAIWGEIKGSGSKPYQVRVDLDPFGYKCSCPSRKLPCKHALGLLFILSDHSDALHEEQPPAWVADWLTDRSERAEKKQAKAQPAQTKPADDAVSDAAAQTKRAAKRTATVQAGVDELTIWLSDLVRQGLASARGQPSSYWDNVAARMVDAQAPGLAYAVQMIAQEILAGEEWQERTLRQVASLHLLLEAFRRIDQLSPDLQATVRSLIGWTVSREELKGLATVRDTWLVVGQKTLGRDRLREQRTWLWGSNTQKPALILQFATTGQPFETALTPGTQIESELVFYPGAWPIRAAVLQTFGQAQPILAVPAGDSGEAALSRFGQALAHQPWLRPWPMLLGSVTPGVHVDTHGIEHWHVQDANGRVLDCPRNLPCGWDLLAISAGHPVTIFGEWDAQSFTPMGAWYAQGSSFMVLGAEPASAEVTR